MYLEPRRQERLGQVTFSAARHPPDAAGRYLAGTVFGSPSLVPIHVTTYWHVRGAWSCSTAALTRAVNPVVENRPTTESV